MDKVQKTDPSSTIPDSKIFERRSVQYNYREGRSVEWERAVTETGPMHSTFIILNIL
jgi:hypothetical protein